MLEPPMPAREPVRLVDSVSANPVWSPNGKLILYSGASRARIVPLKGATPDGQPSPVPAISVDRVGDSYRFLPGGDEIVVKLGHSPSGFLVGGSRVGATTSADRTQAGRIAAAIRRLTGRETNPVRARPRELGHALIVLPPR
jgi:hypothetical protein